MISRAQAGKTIGRIRLSFYGGVLVILLTLSLLPVFLYRFLPFHDYPNGVFQGYLLRLARHDPTAVARHYSWMRSPVPYSAWSAVAWVLNSFIQSPELVGKAFFVLTTLVFAGGASYLIRSVQGHSTVFELLPLVWVYDRYAYDGLLNYHLSVGLCLFSVGYLHRSTEGATRVPTRRALFVLSVFSVLTYLSHFMGWVALCLALGIYCVLLCLRQRSLSGLWPTLSLLPAGIMLGWYTVSRVGTINTVLYSSLLAKLYAWAPVLLLFFRLEPFGIQAPLAFILNVCVLLTVGAMAVAFAEPHPDERRRLSFHVAALAAALGCLTCAVVIPFLWFAGSASVDARLLQPILWLAIASIRYRRPTLRHTGLVVLLVMMVLSINVAQFARVQPQLVEILEALNSAVSPDDRVYSVSLRSPPLSLREAVGNGGLINFTVGMPILDYFDLYRFVAQEGYAADLGIFETAWLANKPDAPPPQLRLAVLSNRDLQATAAAIRTQAEQFDVVELFGDPAEVREVEAHLQPALVPMAQGTYYSVLTHANAPP